MMLYKFGFETSQEEKEILDLVVKETLKTEDEQCGRLIGIADFFDDVGTKLEKEFDVVIYRISAMPRYYLGFAASRAYMVLQDGGTFALDLTGFAGDIDEVITIVEYLGFTWYDGIKNTVYFFRKEKMDGTE